MVLDFLLTDFFLFGGASMGTEYRVKNGVTYLGFLFVTQDVYFLSVSVSQLGDRPQCYEQ